MKNMINISAGIWSRSRCFFAQYFVKLTKIFVGQEYISAMPRHVYNDCVI